jgi:hypothetical protein
MSGKVGNPGWKKGQSGNPGGRRKQDYTFRDLAHARCPAALKRLVEISKQSEDLRAAYSACMGILAYGVGKPIQPVDLTNSDGSLAQAWAQARAGMEAEASQEEAGVTH